jgi:hypothetical protein
MKRFGDGDVNEVFSLLRVGKEGLVDAADFLLDVGFS